MLIEVLSDHPGASIRQTEIVIQDQQKLVDEHFRAVAALKAQHAASRRWWQIGKWLRQNREVRALRARRPVVDTWNHHRLAQQRAGAVAEDQMTYALQSLSDDWLLFRGYANRKGEVDHLLVGPGGIWAIEVKSRAVTVHIDGDAWWYEKFDRYGNQVDEGTLVDRGGRSWGRQVMEIARELQGFLRSRGVNVTVESAVVVIHDRARLGSTTNLQTNVSIGTEYMMGWIQNEPPSLDADIRRRIAQLVRRDHAFNATRRTQHRRRR